MTDLSILIPSRCEMFLARTIQDILAHIEADTEIIVTLDGEWADPPIPDDPRVTLLYYAQPIGQRAGINAAARIARGKYLMKVDAHCAFDQGFDRKMLEVMQPDWTAVPLMRNLHIFDWVCPGGHRRYQGPSGDCKECGQPTVMDVVWIAKESPKSRSYCFDPSPHFQYFNEYSHRPEGKGLLTETMSLQGSCFMVSREKFFELNLCDEEWGFWGSQGIEVAAKTWLSGGRVVVNHNTWYAHCFRTQGGDFGFPYPLSGSQVDTAKRKAREMLYGNSYPKQIYPSSWLVEKFWPLPGWSDEDLVRLKANDSKIKVRNITPIIPATTSGPSKAILYYTDNRLDPLIMQDCQNQIIKSVNGHKIISVSLQPINFGQNIVVPQPRGYLTMFKQILAGLEASTADIVFLCEHDVLYHQSHFDFVPPEKDVFYYNINVWKVRSSDGHALHYDCKQTSGLCAYRELLVEHYRQRVKNTEEAFTRLGGNTRAFRDWIRKQGFEPGTHNRSERVDDHASASWRSAVPIVDIRHDQNLTPSRWKQDEFRNKRNCIGWTEADSVPGVGVIKYGR